MGRPVASPTTADCIYSIQLITQGLFRERPTRSGWQTSLTQYYIKGLNMCHYRKCKTRGCHKRANKTGKGSRLGLCPDHTREVELKRYRKYYAQNKEIYLERQRAHARGWRKVKPIGRAERREVYTWGDVQQSSNPERILDNILSGRCAMIGVRP